MNGRAEVLATAEAAYPQFAAAASEINGPLLPLVAAVAESLSPYCAVTLQREIEFLAYLVERAAQGAVDPRERLAALRQVLAVEEGLRGNLDDYYDPDNSFIDRVLRRGLGVPISLSAIYLAVAGELGWPLVGLDFPCHYLVRYQQPGELLVVDPFRGGCLLRFEECVELGRPAFQRLPEEQVESLVRARLERPCGRRRMVGRMLKNLESIYLQQRDYPAVKNVIEKLLLLDPGANAELRDLGGVFHLLGDHRRALECLRGYLIGTPTALDRQRVEAMVDRLENLLDED
ncbi:MAG: tetratricopeptide repeat protein [Armatimonadetes bacterium]|nr:tetratricopeptide repeat protein [Armatimonadota bacterium]